MPDALDAIWERGKTPLILDTGANTENPQVIVAACSVLPLLLLEYPSTYQPIKTEFEPAGGRRLPCPPASR
jgi:hypothetical protein